MAQNLNYLIEFQRLTEGARDAFNVPAETWTTVCKEWADKRDVSDSEKIAAGQQYSTRLARFTVRWNRNTASITSDDRLIYDGAWNVLGKKEVERNRLLEVTAEKRSD